MRFGGPFPLNPAGTFPISQSGGQYFYVPPGNYLITLGAESVLQWWDPVLSWRNYTCPPGSTMAISIDGYNYRIINMSGVVQAAVIGTAGSGGTNGIGPTQTGTTLSVASPGGTGTVAKGYVIIGGAVGTAGGSMTITQAGSGFVVPPLIIVDPPPAGGIQCTATSTITTGGALNSVTTVNPGAGYLSVPNVYVIPQFLDYPGQPALPYTLPTPPTPIAPNFPPGAIFNAPGGGITVAMQQFMQGLYQAIPTTSGALVTAPALAGSGTQTGLVITDFGSAYATSVPAITIAGGTLTGSPTATAVMAWAVQSVSSFTGATIANNATGVESSLGQIVLTNNNNLLLGRPMRGAATTGGVVTVQDPGFAIQTTMAAGSIGLVGSGVSVNSTGGGVGTMGPVTDTTVIQMFINE